MARLIGDTEFTGTINGLCVYKMYGDYFVRTKSSLTGKRFWKDKAFEGSRKSCNLLAKASSIASLFYKAWPKEAKRKGLFNEMTGRVKLWLKEGKNEEEALLLLQENYTAVQKEIKEVKQPAKKKKAVVANKRKKLFIVAINEQFSDYKRTMARDRAYYLRE